MLGNELMEANYTFAIYFSKLGDLFSEGGSYRSTANYRDMLRDRNSFVSLRDEGVASRAKMLFLRPQPAKLHIYTHMQMNSV